MPQVFGQPGGRGHSRVALPPSAFPRSGSSHVQVEIGGRGDPRGGERSRLTSAQDPGTERTSRLIEKAKAPNIVLFSCAMSGFFVVCAKSQNTQAVHTRSALCWLRKKAGLGFACDASGGVFSLRVSRDRCALQGDSWPKDLEPLVSAVGTVFAAPSFDE